jgi:hypothetical protein
MQPYDDLVELAKECARQARFTANREVALELWRMAREYQTKAATLGKPPEIGAPPTRLAE